MASRHVPAPARRCLYGLDWLNFFIADVQTAFGPFVAVYLASHGWSPGDIGLVFGIGGAASVVSQAPGGWLIDAIPVETGDHRRLARLHRGGCAGLRFLAQFLARPDRGAAARRDRRHGQPGACRLGAGSGRPWRALPAARAQSGLQVLRERGDRGIDGGARPVRVRSGAFLDRSGLVHTGRDRADDDPRPGHRLCRGALRSRSRAPAQGPPRARRRAQSASADLHPGLDAVPGCQRAAGAAGDRAARLRACAGPAADDRRRCRSPGAHGRAARGLGRGACG
jgi:hypothetical protein